MSIHVIYIYVCCIYTVLVVVIHFISIQLIDGLVLVHDFSMFNE